MTIHYDGHPLHASFPASPADLHAQRALAQSARFAADLAIARWSGAAGTATPARADWIARTHDGLQQWMAAGGFAQYDIEAPLVTPGDDGALPFPGKRPLYYTLFRQSRSTVA